MTDTFGKFIPIALGAVRSSKQVAPSGRNRLSSFPDREFGEKPLPSYLPGPG